MQNAKAALVSRAALALPRLYEMGRMMHFWGRNFRRMRACHRGGLTH